MNDKGRFTLPDTAILGYVPSPGEVIRDELKARGLTQKDLAVEGINEITDAKKEITAETAIELSAAFGTSADFWLNLEKDYRLWLQKRKEE